MPPPRQLMRPGSPGGYVPSAAGDSGRDPFSVVFAVTGTATFRDAPAAYTGYEVWVFSDGLTVKVENGHPLTVSQPGIPIDGTTFDVTADPPQLALGRIGPGAGGRVWELAAFGESAAASSGASNCISKLAGLRATECVSFSTPGNDLVAARSFGGKWNAAAAGWKGLDFFVTGDGITFVVLFRKAEGGMGLRLIGETQTWYAADLGCTGGKQRFAVPFCPPDTLDGSGSDTGTGDCADLTGCTDHTFLVDVVCVACDDAAELRGRVVLCEDWEPTPVTLYLTVTAVSGTCSSDYVGITIPVYYVGGAYYPLQSDVDASGWPCSFFPLVGRPNDGPTAPPLFALGFECDGSTALLIGTGGSVTVTETDPFEAEIVWDGGTSQCCASPPGGSITALVTETPP